ncbi:MAG: hypothetical protein HFF44_07125 [Lawsonibacter sp.]|nr:hypothetical protein [Lawsonibacter sp.]
MREDKKRRAVELGKDALIVLLAITALLLLAQTPLVGPLRELFQEEGAQTVSGQIQGVNRAEGAVPLAMVANLPGGSGQGIPEGTEGVRCGILYDQAACQELFQRVAGTLAEVLSSASAPEAVSRAQWEHALTDSLGVYMDFQGEIPMPVLVGWLSGGETSLNATVRRLVLTIWEDGVDLYYRSEEDGLYYRCRDQVADSFSLAEALAGLTDNGAFYAFESELYEALDPDTLLLAAVPAPAVYTASNPMNAGQGALQDLVQDLGFSLNSTSFYSTDEQVARSGDDSVRLSAQGVAQYQYDGKGGGGLFPVLRQGEAGELFDSVETCRQLALSALGPRCGEARLYLTGVLDRPEGWEIEFGYSLNQIPVLLDGGCAARFLVENGEIVQFSLYLRSYTNSGTTTPVLPPRQGAAALLARGLAGEELLLTYAEAGENTVSAVWAAREAGTGED